MPFFFKNAKASYTVFKLFILFFLLSVCPSIQAGPQSSLDDVRQSAQQGNAEAQAKLGAMYLLGRNGVELDEQKAADWLLKSANQGFIEAEVIMAALYDRGIGVKTMLKRRQLGTKKPPLKDMVLHWLFWAKMLPPRERLRLIIKRCV
jgi:FOG: TPR repeat, SEL1 subfamily